MKKVTMKKMLAALAVVFTMSAATACEFNADDLLSYLNPENWGNEAVVNKYTVKFVNFDGTVLQEGEVEEGQTPVYTGATPTKAATAQYSYTFAGWDIEIVAATADVVYTATYTETLNQYTVKFVDFDGTVLQEGLVNYGTMPQAPADPTREATAQYTYTFDGWDNAVANVTGAVTYTATYTETLNQYTVRFVDSYGKVLKEGLVNYGAMPEIPADLTKEADAQYTYTFATWDKEIVAVTGAVTYTATYTETLNQYMIKFVDFDGTVLKEGVVDYGTMPQAPADPTRDADVQYTYTFTGWNNEVVTVTGAATYTATYEATLNTYVITLKFNNGQGDYIMNDVEYGTEASVLYANVPTYAGHYFLGWYIGDTKVSETETVKGDLTVEAKWLSYEDAMVQVTNMFAIDTATKSTVSVADAGIGQPATAQNQNVTTLTAFTETDANGQVEFAVKTPYMYQTLDKMNPTDVVRFWVYMASTNTSAKISAGSIYVTNGGWPTWGTNDELVRINTWHEWDAYRKNFVANAWIPMDVTVAELQSGYKAISGANHITFYISCGTAGAKVYLHSVELIQSVSATAGTVGAYEWVNRGNGIETPDASIGVPQNAISKATTVAAVGRRSDTSMTYTASVYKSADIYNLILGLRTMNANDKLGFWVYCDGTENDTYTFEVSFFATDGSPNEQSVSKFSTPVTVKGGGWQLAEVSVGDLKEVLASFTTAKTHTRLGLVLKYKYQGTTAVTEKVYCHSIEYIKAN